MARKPVHSAEGAADLKRQFPADPDRAAELGLTYGEAAPERPGQRARPKSEVTTVVPAASHARESQPSPDMPHPVSGPDADQGRKASKAKAGEKELEQVMEKVGRRGRYG